MSDILVVGSFVMDMTARVDHFAKDGETLLAKSFYRAPGGKGVNQAVAAARLGADVEMVGCVSDDSFGNEFISLLSKEGIKHDHILISSSQPTGMAHIQIDERRQNRIVVIPGANHDLTVDKVDLFDDSIRNCEVIILQFEIPLETSIEILKRAKKYGKTTILNPAPAMKIDDDVFSYVDYLTPNDVEVGALANVDISSLEDVKKAANILLNKGVKHLLVTIGKDGAYFVDKDNELIVPSFPVKAIDTVGAGDSFNGAFATRLLETSNIVESIRFATAEGALTVTKQGAIPALHTRKELEKFLSKDGK